jgi:hypothetical protein
MRNFLSLASALALSATALLAQQVTVPAIFANAEGGTSGNIWRLGPNRVQCLYDSTNFTTQGVLAPVQITSVEWRLAGAGVTNIVTYPTVSIYLQPAAVDFLTPNLQFDLNRTIAFPTTPNFTGSVTTVAVSGTTPNDYFITIPLTTPFNFDPSLGQDLLIEIEIPTAPAPVLGNVISTGFNAAAHLCNSVRSVGSTAALTGVASAFCPVARINYTPVPGAAINTPLGTGCVKKFTSFYELFALPANWDLNGQALTIVPTGAGNYAVSPGGAFLPIGSVATPPVALALGDDAEVVQTFTVGAFAGPNGAPWPSVNVISNGAISENTGHPTAVAGGGAPDLTINLNATSTTFYGALADWDPSVATGGGNVYWEESATVTSITWDNVPNWTATGPGLPNTFQIQLYPSGLVVVAWTNLQSFGNNGGVLVGYSPGGPSEIPPARDLSAIGSGFVTDPVDVRGLTVTGLTRPVLNTSWSLQVSEIPATAVFGLDIFGTIDPGINDLSLLGIPMPGCGLRATLDTVVGPWFNTGPTHNYGFTVPNVPSLVGFNVYTTSAVFENPPQNGFGAITANGIEGKVGSI